MHYAQSLDPADLATEKTIKGLKPYPQNPLSDSTVHMMMTLRETDYPRYRKCIETMHEEERSYLRAAQCQQLELDLAMGDDDA